MEMAVCQREFDEVFHRLTHVSFGPKVYSDAAVCTALRGAIAQMHVLLSVRQTNDIHLNMASEVGSQFMRENISKLKKDDERRMCFECALMLLVAKRQEFREAHFVGTDELLERYPEFASSDTDELMLLVTFRNFMCDAVKLVEAKNHKNYLLDLCTRVAEGRHVKYITGTGQKESTSRRVLIFQREGNIVPVSRPPRQRLSAGEKSAKDKARSSMTKEKISAEAAKIGSARARRVASSFMGFHESRLAHLEHFRVRESVSPLVALSDIAAFPRSLLGPVVAPSPNDIVIEHEELFPAAATVGPLPVSGTSPTVMVKQDSFPFGFFDECDLFTEVVSLDDMEAHKALRACSRAVSETGFSSSELEVLEMLRGLSNMSTFSVA